MAEQARSSALLSEYHVSVIHHGLDTAVFRPCDRDATRHAFAVPSGRPVIAFAAAAVSDKRKGMRHLGEALAAVPGNPFVLTWGRSFPAGLDAFPHLHLGHIESEHLAAVAYSAADCFVMPSVEEAFGQTALEAMACGVPVVAFAAGGIPDVVRHEETGLLVPVGDTSALACAIARLLANPTQRMQWGEAGRTVAEREFTLKRYARDYEALYQSMMEDVSRAGTSSRTR